MEKTLFARSSFHLTLKYSAINGIRGEKHIYTHANQVHMMNAM